MTRRGRAGQGGAGQGRAGQGRAGWGRARYASANLCQKHDRGGEMQTDSVDNMHIWSTSPHTPITFHCRGGQHQKATMEREKRVEQDKEDQDWQKIHVCATRNRRIKGNAAKSPAPNRRAAKGPSQHTPGQMPLALGWGASVGHTSPP